MLAAALAVALPLAGCGSGGFQPMYGSQLGGGTRMASVDIAPVPGRVGQRIRNELLFERSATGEAQMTKRLEIKITDSVLTQFVQESGESTGQAYQIEASYRLIDLSTQKVEFEGRSLGRTNYERFASPYSNVRAREDAENRAAVTIANDIRTRLAAHLSRG
jgi:LPS-assembly lipoprotein